ncbi:MAG TPA: response regulator [Chitinophagales bacterium]|nr:response regulator [Chitinophagales bacterium]
MNNVKNVLLVDDDPEDQEFFLDALSEIETANLYDLAHNGKEALDMLENSVELPSLIFMEIHLPMMNGIECLTEIIKKPLIKEIPVVIITSDTWHLETVRKLGAKAFIKKPVYIDILRKQVEQLINLDFIKDIHIANQTFQTALAAS